MPQGAGRRSQAAPARCSSTGGAPAPAVEMATGPRHTGRMPAFVVFLRAVNVAGRRVPMAALRQHLGEVGLRDVESYIQSGNLRFSTPQRDAGSVGRLVERVVAEHFGVSTTAIVRTPQELADLVAAGEALADPFPGPSRRYVALLADRLSPEAAAAFDGWSVPGERARVGGREVFLWFTGPFHQARLNNARIEKAGVPATTRDWKVVTAVAQRWATV